MHVVLGNAPAAVGKAGERGRQGGEYLGPRLVRGPEILVKYLVMGAPVKRVGGP